MKIQTTLLWIVRLVAAGLMLQTLFFKFTAQEESVQIFTTLGIEPWGRIGTGILELIAAILILIPSLTAWGALLGLGLMMGAIFFHLTKLGIEVNGDPILFIYGVIVFICCAILLVVYRSQILRSFLGKVRAN